MHPPVDCDVPVEDLNRAARYVRESDRLAVLTGAGVSAESGLSTFRGPDGLWEGQRPEENGGCGRHQRGAHIKALCGASCAAGHSPRTCASARGQPAPNRQRLTAQPGGPDVI